MAIPFLRSSAHRYNLVLCGIPVDFQVVLLAFLVECFVHLVHDHLVGATLERDHLPKVVEAFAASQLQSSCWKNSSSPRSRYNVTSTPRLQASNVAGMTGDALKVGDCLIIESAHSFIINSRQQLPNYSHEDALLSVLECCQPCNVLRDCMRALVSGSYERTLNSCPWNILRDINSLPFGRRFTIAIGTGSCLECKI